MKDMVERAALVKATAADQQTLIGAKQINVATATSEAITASIF
jgi:hypothetical protein